MAKKIALTLTVIILLSFAITNNFRELVQKKLSNYIDNYPEKVYVQTDKPYYTLGEDIWYSTYLVNGVNHRKTNKSRVVYVELINEEDSIVSKKQLYAFDVNVAGDFKIEKDWTPGNYILRAYTNYMRNQSPDYFFKKQIPIWDITKTDSIKNIASLNEKTNLKRDSKITEKPDIKFYPEGGYLVNGLASKVGIKVQDKNNRDVILEGVIKDSNNKTICPFKTLQFGLGIATLIPEPNKTYYALVTVNDVEYTYPLPKALPNGYNLNIVNNGNHLIAKVTTNNELGLKNSYLLGHQRGTLVFEKLETKNTNSYTIKLNTNSLTDGVTHFTLFNNEGKPVCERLVYIDNPDNDIKVNLVSNNTSPSVRDHINLNIGLQDKEGNHIAGNLSMSITDIDAIGQSSKTENIKTYLLLNSDLRGHIENPGYFFEKENDPKRRYLLDLIMLTHGWRRFTWNELLYKNPEDKTIYNPEIGLYISGHVAPKRKRKTQIPASTRITFMGTFPYQEKKLTDSNGKFKYGPFVFMDTMPTILEARMREFQKEETKSNRLVDIYLDKNYSPSPKITRKSIVSPIIEDVSKISTFLKQSKDISKIDEEFLKEARLLDEVVITATIKSEKDKRNEALNERAFYGYPTNRIDMADYESMQNQTILELLSMLPGVNVVNDSISIRGGGSPSIYLNNIPVEYTDINTMTGADVDFIDVLKGVDAAYFPNSANGVIVIHQKEGADFFTKNIKRKPGIIDFTSLGFYTAREFYAPDHVDPFITSSKQDIRTTLHWEPKINLNSKTPTANISFFTSDTRSNYAIKIEGITDTGIPVYHLSTFEVD